MTSSDQDPRDLKKLKRYEHLKKRATLTQEERASLSSDVCHNVRRLLAFLPSYPIALYAPTAQELDVTSLCNVDRKIYFPRVDAKTLQMDFFLLRSMSDFQEGPYGIREPKSQEKLPYDQPAIFVMPSLALSRKDGVRLGYGGGFYDRYFEKHPDSIKVAPNFSCHIEHALPFESFDKIVDYIVTESEIAKVS